MTKEQTARDLAETHAGRVPYRSRVKAIVAALNTAESPLRARITELEGDLKRSRHELDAGPYRATLERMHAEKLTLANALSATVRDVMKLEKSK